MIFSRISAPFQSAIRTRRRLAAPPAAGFGQVQQKVALGPDVYALPQPPPNVFIFHVHCGEGGHGVHAPVNEDPEFYLAIPPRCRPPVDGVPIRSINAWLSSRAPARGECNGRSYRRSENVSSSHAGGHGISLRTNAGGRYLPVLAAGVGSASSSRALHAS